MSVFQAHLASSLFLLHVEAQVSFARILHRPESEHLDSDLMAPEDKQKIKIVLNSQCLH